MNKILNIFLKNLKYKKILFMEHLRNYMKLLLINQRILELLENIILILKNSNFYNKKNQQIKKLFF